MKRCTACFLLALCLLLAASCGGQAGTDAAPPGPPPQVETAESGQTESAEANEAAQEPTQEERRAAAAEEVRYVNFLRRHISGITELYRLEHPQADVHWSMTEMTPEGALTLRGYGVDMAGFAASGLLPEGVKVLFDADVPDARLSEPIPREPESVHTENGMTVAMDRAVYPLWPEYISCTMTNETGKSLEYSDTQWLAKWVDGEWVPLPGSGNSLLYQFYVSPGESKPLVQRLNGFTPLGEGLYRYYIHNEDYWAEFAVSAQAEPLDLTEYVYLGAADAAFLRLGLSWERVEDLSYRTLWPARAYEWKFGSPRSPSDEELVGALLGEDAVCDEEAGVYRAGERSLDLRDGVRLQTNSTLGLALRLLLEGDGAVRLQKLSGPRLSNGEGDPFTLLSGESWGNAVQPTPEELNAALQKALKRRGETLSPEERAALKDFRFTSDMWVSLAFYAYGEKEVQSLGFRAVLCPIAGVPALAWYARSGDTVLELYAPLRSYSFDKDQLLGNSRSPYEAAEALWEGLDEEQRAEKLLSFDYQLVPGDAPSERDVYVPAWVLETEAEDGTLHHFAVDARSLRFYGELDKRQWVNNPFPLLRGIFERYRAEDPDADVYLVSMQPDREGGHWLLRVECDGVDIPALKSSGLLPDFVRLEYDHEKFNQKQAHEIPREPEWIKEYNGGGTVIAMEKADWPLYPDELRFTVRVNAPTQYSPWIEKWADGEWHGVRSTITDTLEMRYVETEENSFSLTHYAKLGPGLYRLHINSLYWVEFTMSAG